MELEESFAASLVVGHSLFSALIGALIVKGLLTGEEVRELYEEALLSLERLPGDSPEMTRVYETARESIEEHLRPDAT